MKQITRSVVLIVCIFFIVFWVNSHLKQRSFNAGINVHNNNKDASTVEKRTTESNNIVIAVVACGDRLRETLNMIKSAIMFTRVRLHFIVFSEDSLMGAFNEKLGQWKSLMGKFTYVVMPVVFPADNADEWRKLFKPCAAQRLFLPSVLKSTDAILYMDTDTLFLTAPENIWGHFEKMNSSQMVALAPEHEDPKIGWYERFAKHPYYGRLGVNSGVMLMNLTRMREFQWVKYVIPIYKRYKLKIMWGDQDIINIIFHFHTDKLYVYDCRHNFRPDHCVYMSICKPAEKEGIAVLHGSRGVFHLEKKQLAFSAVYKAFEEFQLDASIYRDFYLPLENYLEAASETNCGHMKDIYLKNLRHYISDFAD